uniref:uncharacterized protein LOC122592037 n=1 Tax=Erigeron canadensis TaxID=72917 RepID=UPI001CB966C8|nr:uncharacterized protein LOC122592037 [Erigeron canadensis]
MPFGLKNAGETYQRLVDKAFHKQIGRNLEVYVDDMVIKSRTEEELLANIQETFETLRKIKMKLNPKKCSFGMEARKFLGYYISDRGIQANPSKVNKILELPAPKTVKEVQSLNGKLAALSRFFSKGADRQLPFFKTLKNCGAKKGFEWTKEADEAFEQMKKHIAELPSLISPRKGETLYIYLAASAECVSTVLLTERDRKQMPIYFVSRILQGAEANYPEMEKLVLALVHAARRLRRVAKWAIELGAYDIEYRARHAVKGQILADFITEIRETGNSVTHSTTLTVTGEADFETWELYTDGASSSEGCGAGIRLVSPDKQEYTYALRFEFETTNNEAEYEALIAGLDLAKDMKIRSIKAFVDSQLVANQVKGEYEAKGEIIRLYLGKTKELIEQFESFDIEHIRRNQNKKADALSKLASLTFEHLGKKVLIKVLKERSIYEKRVHDLVREKGKNWMTPIIEYLVSGIFPEDESEARKIRIKAPQYKLMEGNLYKKAFVTPWLRCVGPKQAETIIFEIHEGICGLHAGPRSVATKALRLGYFWPSMHRDAAKLLHNCEACQLHANVPRLPKQDMTSVTSAWPFTKWGIDIVGPLPKAPGKVKFLIVAIDYFTKWVEAKPVATINGKTIENFVWEYRIYRFGLPQMIVSDNGKQFAEGTFTEMCQRRNIKQSFTSVYHP